MTDLKLNETTQETTTVELNLENQFARIESSKHKVEFIVSKTRYSPFFSIKTSKGVLPHELSGKFTSLEIAVKTIEAYVKNSKETFAVKSDRLHEERQKRKHAEANAENS